MAPEMLDEKLAYLFQQVRHTIMTHAEKHGWDDGVLRVEGFVYKDGNDKDGWGCSTGLGAGPLSDLENPQTFDG